MHDLILHHYDLSPYAEMIRLILGFKRLAWKSVQIPMVAPKPDLTCLTGGYRKTPVLQLGADIYCDTKTIARALETLRPQPTIYLRNADATERALSSLADALFLQAVTIMLGAGVFPEDFIADRQKMFPGSFTVEQARRAGPAKLDQVRAALAALDAQLDDGRAFLLGDAVSLADFSIYNPVSFLPMAPAAGGLLAPFAHLAAWRERMRAIGHGERSEIDAETAIAVARAAEPTTAVGVDPAEPNGYRAGERLTIMPEDYGMDPVTGELVASNPYEIALRRTDPRVGEVVVHFPRSGYLLFRAS